MFGGFVHGTKTNDLLEYNLRTGQVKQIEVGSSRPASAYSDMSATKMRRLLSQRVDLTRPLPRTGSRMVFSHAESALFLFGG